MNCDELDTSASFTQLGLPLSSNLTWKTHIHSLAKHASQKLGFLARARGFFSSSQLLTINKSQICPSFEYCCHVSGGAQTSTLCLLEEVLSKAIRPTSHHSILEHATYGTSCLLLAFLNLSISHLSNPRYELDPTT